MLGTGRLVGPARKVSARGKGITTDRDYGAMRGAWAVISVCGGAVRESGSASDHQRAARPASVMNQRRISRTLGSK